MIESTGNRALCLWTNDRNWPTASGRQEAERVTAILRIAARQYLDGWQAVDDPKQRAPGKAGKG